MPRENHNGSRCHASNGGSLLEPPSHLRFESMMSESAGHLGQLAVIADRKPQRDRMVFLAELHLWRERGRSNHVEWQAMCESGDLQERLQELVHDRCKVALSCWSMKMARDGRLVSPNSVYNATY
jgi:hypothetical protein